MRNKKFIAVLILTTISAGICYAGNLDSSEAPAASGATLTDIMNRISSGTAAGEHTLQPTAAPGATMFTLDEIFGAIPGGTTTVTAGDVRQGKTFIDRSGGEMTFSTGTMPSVGQQNVTPTASAQPISEGYHDGTGQVDGDVDLVAGNIKDGVEIFGVPGNYTGKTGVVKTGQTSVYTTGDDGTYQAGLEFDYSSSTINGDVVVIDNNTGLMWAADGNEAGCLMGGTTDWFSAIEWAEGLEFAGYTDWRLPNMKELFSLISDYDSTGGPVFIDTTYFPNTVGSRYWSSTTYAPDTPWAMLVPFNTGYVLNKEKTDSVGNYVRAVRGGP